MTTREIKEGKQDQGIEEEVTYTLTVPATWGTPTTPLTIKTYSLDEVTGLYTDVTSTVMPAGSGSALGQVITLPEIKSLTENVLYRVEIKFATSEGDVKEAFAWIRASR